MTYGDAVTNLNIPKSLNSHIKSKKLATLAAVNPPPRFGNLILKKNNVVEFSEKNKHRNGLINGGFFVVSPKVIDLIANDNTVWEQGPLQKLAKKNQLNAYIHRDFWQPMDTLYEKNLLNSLWSSNNAPWKIWRE